MSKANDDIVIYGVGDIGPNRPDPGSIFKHVTNVIKNGDISLAESDFYLSGNQVTMDLLTSALNDRGIPSSQMKTSVI